MPFPFASFNCFPSNETTPRGSLWIKYPFALGRQNPKFTLLVAIRTMRKRSVGSRRRFGVKKDCELVAIRTMRKRSVRVVVLVSKQIVKEHTGTSLEMIYQSSGKTQFYS
jgi:hypothetical protein